MTTVTKMSKAAELFKEVHSDGYKLTVGSSVRNEFMKRSQSEIQLTEHGAGTYWHTLTRKSKGLPGYYKSKKKEVVIVDVTPETV